MKKKPTYYKFDYIGRFHNCTGQIFTKFKLIKRFISFLRNPEELKIQITKINNVIISQNQTWEYDDVKEDYILETDLRGKENHELYNKDKYIE
jgi:hypothetical protein